LLLTRQLQVLRTLLLWCWLLLLLLLLVILAHAQHLLQPLKQLPALAHCALA
jgi:hypothetical protein